MDSIQSGQYTLTQQNEKQVSYASKLNKDMGRIDWTKTASCIYSQIKGLKPWPGTYTSYHGKHLKIIEAEPFTAEPLGKPGQVVAADKNGLLIETAAGRLLIKVIQPEASKPMPASSFIAGYKIKPGDFLR